MGLGEPQVRRLARAVLELLGRLDAYLGARVQVDLAEEGSWISPGKKRFSRPEKVPALALSTLRWVTLAMKSPAIPMSKRS